MRPLLVLISFCLLGLFSTVAASERSEQKHILQKVGYIVYLDGGILCMNGKATVRIPDNNNNEMLSKIGIEILSQPLVSERCPNAKVLVWVIPGIAI